MSKVFLNYFLFPNSTLLRDSTLRVCVQNKNINCEASQLRSCLPWCVVFTGKKISPTDDVSRLSWPSDNKSHWLWRSPDIYSRTTMKLTFWGRLKWQCIDFTHDVQTFRKSLVLPQYLGILIKVSFVFVGSLRPPNLFLLHLVLEKKTTSTAGLDGLSSLFFFISRTVPSLSFTCQHVHLYIPYT